MQNVGIDIVELARLKDVKEGFLEHVLSSEEIAQYNSYKGTRKTEFLGGRFAAKEAIIKCLSDYEIPSMPDIVITNREDGKPIVKYKDYKLKVSISHERDYAVAIAILD